MLHYIFAMRAGAAPTVAAHGVSLACREADAVDGHAHQLTMTIVSLCADSRSTDEKEQNHQQRQYSLHNVSKITAFGGNFQALNIFMVSSVILTAYVFRAADLCNGLSGIERGSYAMCGCRAPF